MAGCYVMSLIQGAVMNQTKPGSRLTAITSANNSSGESSPENTNYLRVSALFGNRYIASFEKKTQVENSKSQMVTLPKPK